MDPAQKVLQTVSAQSSVHSSHSQIPKLSNRGRQGKKCYHLTPRVIKYFGFAICKFIQSSASSHYLRDLMQKENIELDDFVDYFTKACQFFEENGNFYTLLTIQMTDDKKMQTFKRITKQVSQIFIKYHSLEWISKQKSTERETLLKCRLKMLNAVRSS